MAYKECICDETGLLVRDYTNGSGQRAKLKATDREGSAFIIIGTKGYCDECGDISYYDISKSIKTGVYINNIRYESLREINLDSEDPLKSFILQNCLTSVGGVNNRISVDSWWANRGFEHQKQQIMHLTAWLHDNAKWQERIYCAVNDVTEYPVCTICHDNKCTFDSFSRGYITNCSRECSWKDPVRNNKIRENTDYVALAEKSAKRNIERYGVSSYFATAEFKQKSDKTKLDRYGDIYYNNMDKSRNTNISRYGVSSQLLLPDQQVKMRKSKFEKHGTIVPPVARKSKAELELMAALRALGINIYPNRKILGNRELDGYCDDKKIAVEYCGLYWHSELNKPGQHNYHHDKYIRCKEQGISLITIFEDEWLESKDKVMSFLKSRFGIFDRRIYARDCNISSINKDDAAKFLNETHIQGRAHNIKSAYGLFHNDALVGCVTYGAHHRLNTGLVLNRLAFKSGIQIIGGASKLVKNTINKFDQDVITWSDNRWSTGKLYESIGFEFDKELGPDYSYYHLKSGKRVPKQSMRKSDTGCPPEITEREWCNNLGYYQIYDCGKRRYVYRNGNNLQ